VRVNLALLFVVLGMFGGSSVLGQSPNASLSGVVLDPDKKSIADAEILVVNDYTRIQYEAKTNVEGFFAVSNLPPGQYRIQVSKTGFKAVIKPDIILNVQDALAITFTLPIGASSVVVTVEGGAPMINTTDATVSTVVDRQFAENLPMNGRSFQTLIDLAPGVVATSSGSLESGQFSVNGQRAASNYWMVDGVGANIGVGTTGIAGNGFGGAVGSYSVLGGTNSLVSVDALQEFRIETSTYAPEFGRTPGGQISIVTRSGTDQFHGTVFDYFRNDVLDANDWFANAHGLAKPAERQNDFGGTFGGPIRRRRTFFFFSYEGLRLALPQTAETDVPDIASRQSAVAVMQPYLNAFPLPNGPELGNGMAPFDASFANRGTLDAYSLRVDDRLTDKLTLFGRYNYSPSVIVQRGVGVSLNTVSPSRITVQTATVGLTWEISPTTSNDLRFNYSRTNASSHFYLDNFGGAVPLNSPPLPSPYTAENAEFGFEFLTGANTQFEVGSFGRNTQRQINVVDGFETQKGAHAIKFGVDYRRLTPSKDPSLSPQNGVPWYHQLAVFLDVPSAEIASPLAAIVGVATNSQFRFQNLGLYAQDTWRATSRLTATYGVRWDGDFAPASISGPNIPRVTSFHNPASLALASAGTTPYNTTYGNFAPRIGVAYQLSNRANWLSVLRGGFGVFYDLASSEVGNAIQSSYPFGATNIAFGTGFPLDPSSAAPPPIAPEQLASPGASLSAFDPHLKLPYTLEWNVAFEQGLGTQQSFSATYVGAAGRRLLNTAAIFSPNPNFSRALLTGNSGSSNYNALQVQFERRLSRGLQLLASYVFAHSIDTGSSGQASDVNPTVSASLNRGPSDFDIRHTFSSALTYAIPGWKWNRFSSTISEGWSVESVILARSAPPVNVFDGGLQTILGAGIEVRPDVVPGQPLYLYGREFPGGTALNPAAFTPPPTDANGNPIRQGDLGRNALRGFGATQWDFALHRDFHLHEEIKLQFRAEMFNVLNHPNFGPPVSDLSNVTQFGQSAETLGQFLGGGNLGGGGFSPLYQIGGPRSIQLALKLFF
jgi:Carboxypeptidase regulatory-like domain/TonB dependent receptor